METAIAKLRDFGFKQFKPTQRLSVVEWAEKNLALSERITEQAGKYSTRSYPYVREILENFTNPKVKQISLCWGSQTAKTTTIYVGVGHSVVNKPAPVLMIYPTQAVVKTFSRDRLLPFFKENQCFVEKMPKTIEGKIDTDRVAMQSIEFDRCSLNLVGGGSRANVRNYPVSILVLDEIDVIHESLRREALDRVKGRRDYKIIQCSTPLEETTGIWGEYKNGDQRKFFVNCPHCLSEISFEWKFRDKLSIRCDESAKNADNTWDLQKVRTTSRYFCQICDKPINDKQKHKMMADGFWKPTSSLSPHRSYHLTSLYSPTLSFGDILVKWKQAEAEVEGIKNFYQGWLALPWKDEILNVSEEKISELEGDYERGEPLGDLRIMSIDVQRTHFWWIVRGFDKDGTSYLIDHGLCPYWEDLDQIFSTYDCGFAVIDTGYGDRTQECYEQLFKRRRNWVGIKGWQRKKLPVDMQFVDPFTGKSRQGRYQIRLLHLDVTVWQGEISQRRSGKIKNWKLYKNCDPTYIAQLSSKWQFEEKDRKGNTKVEWRTKGKAGDHYWDCETYCLAFSKLVGFGSAKNAENLRRMDSRNDNQLTQDERSKKTTTPTQGFWG